MINKLPFVHVVNDREKMAEQTSVKFNGEKTELAQRQEFKYMVFLNGVCNVSITRLFAQSSPFSFYVFPSPICLCSFAAWPCFILNTCMQYMQLYSGRYLKYNTHSLHTLF